MIAAVDGHDADAVERAIARRRKRERRRARRSSAAGRSIGKGAPNKAGTARRARRSRSGGEEVAATREALGWPHAAVRDPGGRIRAAGMRAHAARRARSRMEARDSSATRSSIPSSPRNSSAACAANCRRELRDAVRTRSWQPRREGARRSPRARPRRTCSKRLAPACPSSIGGSADLTGSNLTHWSGCDSRSARRPAATT